MSSKSQDFSEGLAAFHASNYAKAFAILRPFADQGEPEAQCIIGSLYQFGWGVQKDIQEAIRWYIRSSEQGYGVASNNLGTIFMVGDVGIPMDREAAKRWYQKAGEQGFSHSPKQQA